MTYLLYIIVIAISIITLGLVLLFTNTKDYTFRIKQGRHYSTLLNSIWVPKLRFNHYNKSVKFISTFDIKSLVASSNRDSLDINKLFGYSEGYHMKNSNRIGWRSLNGKIQLFLFIHRDNQFAYKPIGSYNIDTPLELELWHDQYSYYGKCGNDLVRLSRNEFLADKLPSYALKPYFGGDNKALVDMDINIKLIKW